jgi:predicted short-subunit dehydrogenase-like oxidoreductase (DUF2520 family)
MKMNRLQSIGIVGNGNVASQFSNFFRKKGCELTKILVRDAQRAIIEQSSLTALYSENFVDLASCDLVLVSVNDDALNEVIEQIPLNCFVAHTSGSIGLQQINRKEKVGVFYPLQTFSKGKEVDMSTVPILIESEDQQFETELFRFAKTLFNRVEIVDSEQRKKLHLAAVFVNNFTNHLYYQADEFLKRNELDFSLLLPLILETAQKVQEISPKNAQTGPAKRKDFKVIEQQERQLSGTQLEIYQLFTQSILKSFEK